METIESIEKRRSTKKFDPSFVIPENDIKKILSLAIKSPTAFNIQHWRFVIVSNQALREQIRSVTWMQPQITDASLLIILCANVKAWKSPDKYWKNIDPEIREGIVEAINTYYEGNDLLQRDEAIRSCGIAAQTIMLAATDLGYESCPMDLSDFNEVGKLINLPDDHLIAMFIAIGKGLEPPFPRGGQLDLDEVIIYDKFKKA